MFWDDRMGELNLAGWFLVFVAGVILLVAVIGIAVTVGQRAVGRTTCRNWSEQTGYPSKFVILNFFGGGTCLAGPRWGRGVKNTLVLTATPRRDGPCPARPPSLRFGLCRGSSNPTRRPAPP